MHAISGHYNVATNISCFLDNNIYSYIRLLLYDEADAILLYSRLAPAMSYYFSHQVARQAIIAVSIGWGFGAY